MSGDARAFELAASFLADVAGRSEPWPEAFAKWAADRRLSPELQRAVRIQIIRAHVFHAVEGPGGNAA